MPAEFTSTSRRPNSCSTRATASFDLARAADVRLHREVAVDGLEVERRDLRAAGAEALGDRCADPACRAGDERDAA